MNYAFSAGGMSVDVEIRNYLDWRPASEIVNTPDLTLQAFVDALKTSGFVQRPVENLAIGCHGHAVGLLQLKLDAAAPDRAFFADVQAVANRGTVNIPPAVLDPRPVVLGVPQAAVLRIIGCEIGQARPYLDKLKTALGGHVVLIASKHIESLMALKRENGMLRFLKYNFTAKSPEPFQDKNLLIDAFANNNPAWFDGTAIPRGYWEFMVSSDLDTIGVSDSMTWIGLNPPIGTQKGLLLNATRWAHVTEGVGEFAVAQFADPALRLHTSASRREFARQALQADPAFAAGHPFPLHKQRGFASYNAFIDGFEWNPNLDNMQVWAGTRHVYIVGTPITKTPLTVTPTNQTSYDIIYDFVTSTGTGGHTGLSETDPNLVTIV